MLVMRCLGGRGWQWRTREHTGVWLGARCICRVGTDLRRWRRKEWRVARE